MTTEEIKSDERRDKTDRRHIEWFCLNPQCYQNNFTTRRYLVIAMEISQSGEVWGSINRGESGNIDD
jgi:hypothetical protein